MNSPLDTHAFIWLDSASARLSSKIRTLMADSNTTLMLGLASVWEIQIKHQLGKLPLNSPLAEIIEEQQQKNRLVIMPITHPHILA